MIFTTLLNCQGLDIKIELFSTQLKHSCVSSHNLN